jgi:hypothetical protein
MGEHWVHVDQRGEQAGFSHAQQLSRGSDEGSSAESVWVTDGVVGRRRVCKDGELLCGWDESGSE